MDTEWGARNRPLCSWASGTPRTWSPGSVPASPRLCSSSRPLALFLNMGLLSVQRACLACPHPTPPPPVFMWLLCRYFELLLGVLLKQGGGQCFRRECPLSTRVEGSCDLLRGLVISGVVRWSSSRVLTHGPRSWQTLSCVQAKWPVGHWTGMARAPLVLAGL